MSVFDGIDYVALGHLHRPPGLRRRTGRLQRHAAALLLLRAVQRPLGAPGRPGSRRLDRLSADRARRRPADAHPLGRARGAARRPGAGRCRRCLGPCGAHRPAPAAAGHAPPAGTLPARGRAEPRALRAPSPRRTVRAPGARVACRRPARAWPSSSSRTGAASTPDAAEQQLLGRGRRRRAQREPRMRPLRLTAARHRPLPGHRGHRLRRARRRRAVPDPRPHRRRQDLPARRHHLRPVRRGARRPQRRRRSARSSPRRRPSRRSSWSSRRRATSGCSSGCPSTSGSSPAAPAPPRSPATRSCRVGSAATGSPPRRASAT